MMWTVWYSVYMTLQRQLHFCIFNLNSLDCVELFVASDVPIISVFR